jgi:hypothetical protein
MDCRASLAMTGATRFAIANEVRRSIAEKAQPWTAALRSQ